MPAESSRGKAQNAGSLDLRLAGGEHPTSFREPRTHERLGTML
jgi:hypothetical protein